ncbi:MAG: polysaccharide biosynthesis protein [Phycisphaerae bacterium]
MTPITLARTADAALWLHPVLIGTVESLAALAGQLALSHMLPQHIGCVVVTDGPEHEVDLSHIDDIAGLPMLGTLSTLPNLHAQQPFTAAIVSLPQSERALISKVRETLRGLNIAERFVPTLHDLLAKPPVSLLESRLAPTSLNMAELIGRTPYGIDRKLVRSAIENKRVLITGAGGSIGSEITRICATFNPSLLVLMERSENSLFEIDRQIAKRFPNIQRKAVLHDVVDADATLRIVANLKPHAVFHAAAHKHVPLMEDHPAHAVTNNVFGTKSIADAAQAVGAERFVFVSTDKAVNPTSAMGATKRLAELYVQHLASQQGPARQTQFAIVRFGNVLGSACSVLPIWSQQLAEGGPITVTDPRMTRFFMTIHEAASLVIQSGSIPAQPTKPVVYVLDMGDPIRILDLAQRFCRLHGYEPKVVDTSGTLAVQPDLLADGPTIDINLTGARPGEKLHEELAYRTDTLVPGQYPGIFALGKEAGAEIDIPAMIADLSAMRTAVEKSVVRAAIRRYIPGFEPVAPYQNANKTPDLPPGHTAAA